MAGVERGGIRGAVVSSVVPLLREIWPGVLRDLLGLEPLVVSESISLPIELRVDRPSEVGTDRIANAVGGRTRRGAPVLVLDLGTATTIDVVGRDGHYHGGVILAGPEVAAEALFQRTAQLPRVALTRPARVIGTNTVDCMHAGMFHGYLGAIEHLVRSVREEMGEPSCPVISTGGLGELFATETPLIDEHLPWLTLEGLAEIWDFAAARRPA
jgi:type III pantothenate kinase